MSTSAPSRSAGPRTRLAWLACALLALAGWAYYPTYASIVSKWGTDMTYSHGALVAPIALWLLWRRRGPFLAAEWRPSWLGVAAIAVSVAAWLVGAGAGVLVVQQFAAVALIPSIVLALLGPRAFAAVAFPLCFLFFAVPFGRGLVPALMQVTADIAVAALKLTGIPVYRSELLLSIPAGDFEVARACSGLNYLVTGVVLGVLYAYITYRPWWKRALFVAASVAVPIAANGVRVYLTVAAAHWSDMRIGTGYDHIVFGRVMFLAVMIAMFWVGLRWRDDRRPGERPIGTFRHGAPPVTPSGALLLVALAAVLLLAGAPAYLEAITARAASAAADSSALIRLPSPRTGWRGPLPGVDGWRPLFEGASAEQAGVYEYQGGGRVAVYVAVYPIGRVEGREMINYRNRLYPGEHARLLKESPVELSLGGERFEARQFKVLGGSEPQLVWYWFMVGDHRTTTRSGAKLREAIEFLTHAGSASRVVTVSTTATDDGAAVQLLQAFVADMDPCVRAGMAPQACAQ